MKKLAFLLTVGLLLGLCACGGPSEQEINEQIVEDSLNNIRDINEVQEQSDEVRDLLETLR